MPTIGVNRDHLFSILGKNYSDEEFSDLCFQYGLELDEVTSERKIASKERGDDKTLDLSDDVIYKIEVPANRYDLLCIEGLAQALLIFQSKLTIPRYTAIQPAQPLKMIVKPNTAKVRPFVVAAVLRNMTFTQKIYDSFIDLQDKLHQNIGRQRKIVSIGTHDLDTVQGPFTYDALLPEQIKFRPLNQTKEYTAPELMKLYSGDSHLKPYLPIIQDKPFYPLITDVNGTVLSFPPIINGEHSKITLNTKNVLIEVTATDLYKASVVLDTMVTMFSGYSNKERLSAEQVEVVMPDGSSQLYPTLPYKTMKVEVEKINGCLGIEESAEKLADLLNLMSLPSKKVDDKAIEVEIPPTRHDIIHACDVYEDVGIAFGYNNIPRNLPQSSTIAGELPVSRLTDKLRDELAHCSFTEALTFVLCSREDISERLGRERGLEEAVIISNPKTIDFQVARTSLLPGILKTIEANKSMPLPFKLFEVADVVLKSSLEDVGARNERRLCAVYYNKKAGLELIHGVLDRVMELLGAKRIIGEGEGYSLCHIDDKTFLDGHCADVLYNGKSIGRLGILHPDVITAFKLTLPCSAFEISIEPFL